MFPFLSRKRHREAPTRNVEPEPADHTKIKPVTRVNDIPTRNQYQSLAEYQDIHPTEGPSNKAEPSPLKKGMYWFSRLFTMLSHFPIVNLLRNTYCSDSGHSFAS